MRADAQRNRSRLIKAAVELILDVGGEPSRDMVAARAGVGIGTLYRHFPDQQTLFHAVARQVLEDSISAGEVLIETASDSIDALRRYMHAAVDSGIGVVNIIHPRMEKRDWPDLLARADKLMTALVSRATRDGSLSKELAVHDIVYALIRFARPLAIGLPLSEERSIAHRHLDFYIDGLCANRF